MPKDSPDQFWLVHGAVACVPLSEVLVDMASFSAEYTAQGVRPPTVVTVCRLLGPASTWDDAATAALAGRFREALGADALYDGNAQTLRSVPFTELPAHVVTGIPGLGGFPKGIGSANFGSDVWIDTYKLDTKEHGLKAQLENTADRESRDKLYVLGWTVTPQPADIAKRIVTCGFARPSLEEEGERFNKRFAAFATANSDALKAKCNVVFFDFITPELSAQVLALNDDLLTEAGIGTIADDDGDSSSGED